MNNTLQNRLLSLMFLEWGVIIVMLKATEQKDQLALNLK